MVKKIKIAISGKANSGKNTVAELLGSTLTRTIGAYKIFAFADPIKEMIMKMFPTTERNILWGPSELRMTNVPCLSNLTYRQVLLDLGKLGRDYDPNIWINATFQMAKDCPSPVVVISDIRFRNEFLAAKNEGYFLIRVVRTNCTQTSTSNDISEVDLDHTPNSDFHCILTNDGSLGELNQKIEEIVAAHFLPPYAFFDI